MSYSVVAIPYFSKEIKKLAKKFPSLKNDFGKLINSLQITQLKALHLEIIVIKSAWQSHPKEKENLVALE